MENRIYVGNLSDDVSVAALRERCAEFGDVFDVELPIDRASGRVRGHAFVTMASAACAQKAVARLNGALFEERRLRVTIAGEEHTSTRTRSNDADGVRIMNQFRERKGMVYDLRCGDIRLTLKMFAEDERQASWRIEGSIKRAAPAESIALAASAGTRAAALESLAQAWAQDRATATVPALDWAGIAQALTAVRAI